MRKTIIPVIVLVAWAGSLVWADEPARREAPDTGAWLRFVAEELRELRRELLDDRIEKQTARVRALERELEQARMEHQDGEAVERTQEQEMLQVDQRLADAGLPADERADLEAVRATAATSDQSYRDLMTRKMTEIGETLRRERLRLESLRASAQALAAPATRSHN